MAEKKHVILKLSLALFAIYTLVNGVIYLFFPEYEISSSGSEPIPPGWIRWFGGILLALSIAGILAFRKPAKQGILITAFAIGSLITGLTLFYTVMFEYDGIGEIKFTLIPAILTTALSILFWISLRQSKEILW